MYELGRAKDTLYWYLIDQPSPNFSNWGFQHNYFGSHAPPTLSSVSLFIYFTFIEVSSFFNIRPSTIDEIFTKRNKKEKDTFK